MIIKNFKFLLTLLILFNISFLSSCSSKAEKGPTKKANAKLPDFFVFIADDLGTYDLGTYGSKDANTPNIDAFAKQGLKFNRAFVNSPSCAPSRAALFTALRSQRNGIEPNHDKTLFEGVTHALGPLKKLNYEIAVFGKISHGHSPNWDHGITHRGGKSVNPQEIEEFLRKRDKNRPLLLMVGSRPPHVPWPKLNKKIKDLFPASSLSLPEKSFDNLLTREDFSRYLKDVNTMDKAFGDSYSLVKKYMDINNTVSLFTSDHGAQWAYGKWTLYDTGVKVPIIASWPDKISPSKSTEAMVSWIDIFPTLVDLAGQQQDLNLDGRSFKNVLLKNKKSHREKIYTTHTAGGINVYPMRSVRTDRWKYIRNLHPEFKFLTAIDKAKNSTYLISWREAAENGDPKAIEAVDRYYKRPAEELYDLHNDPYETKNLANDPEYQQILKQLRADIDLMMESTNDQKMVHGKPKYL